MGYFQAVEPLIPRTNSSLFQAPPEPPPRRVKRIPTPAEQFILDWPRTSALLSPAQQEMILRSPGAIAALTAARCRRELKKLRKARDEIAAVVPSLCWLESWQNNPTHAPPHLSRDAGRRHHARLVLSRAFTRIGDAIHLEGHAHQLAPGETPDSADQLPLSLFPPEPPPDSVLHLRSDWSRRWLPEHAAAHEDAVDLLTPAQADHWRDPWPPSPSALAIHRIRLYRLREVGGIQNSYD